MGEEERRRDEVRSGREIICEGAYEVRAGRWEGGQQRLRMARAPAVLAGAGVGQPSQE